MPELALKIPDKPKLDKPKDSIDILKVVNLHDQNKLSFSKIGRLIGYSKSRVHQAYQDFYSMFPNVTSQEVRVYADNKPAYLNYAEYVVLQKLMDDDKLEKASTNNLGYVYDKLYGRNREERGLATSGGVTVNIEIAYQEATDRSRDLRLKHAGSSETIVMDNDLQE